MDDVQSTASLLSASVRDLAEADHQSVISMIQELVQIPSRGGLDPYDAIIDHLVQGFANIGLSTRQLKDKQSGRTVGLVCDIPGGHAGPRYVLDACLDTAPFGNPHAWRYPPTSATVVDGWLYGRGAADSKAAIAIFMHLAGHVHTHADELHGSLTLLFDADEHTGGFGGAKRYFNDPNTPSDIDGVMIGYPGADQLVVGGRGFLRADLTVYGEAGHTGSQRAESNINAIEKAADLIGRLAERRTPGPMDPELGLPPKLTVTKVTGGESYSIIPDHCTVSIDVRLTKTFDADRASALIQTIAMQADDGRPSPRATDVIFHESWPAYALDEHAPIRVALTRAAQRQLPDDVIAKVGGPSNIGNYLAKLGIDATAGLGVAYEGLHGTDERIDLSTIPAVQATYHEAVLTLLSRWPCQLAR